MKARSDVAVLGSGIDGLAAAVVLARKGRAVVVLEEGLELGGRDAYQEFHPGFRASGLVPDVALVPRALLEPLGLERHGLAWRDDAPPLLVPHESGCPLLFQRDAARMNGELPAEERARLAAVAALCARMAPVVADVLAETPPDLARPRPGEILSLARKALRLRGMGKSALFALARTLPSSAADWMEDALRMESARVALTAPALAGTVLGPRAPGTSTFVFLRQALAGPGPRGGSGALVQALLAECRALGVELGVGRALRELRLGPDGIRALVLEDGSEHETRAVLSTLSPARTLLELVPAGVLPLSLERAVQSFRARGATAVLRLALRQPPTFAGREREPVEHAVSAASLLALERAADALKYRCLPAAPWIEVHVASRSDPALAPAGAAVAIVQCHTAPRDLSGEGGWTEANRARLERAMLAAFEGLAPGLGESVVARELITPADIEARHRTPGGHVHDGELALDQLWLQRPSLALSRYATPIPGLFLGGPGSHPGGPFRGGSGVLAARALLARS